MAKEFEGVYRGLTDEVKVMWDDKLVFTITAEELERWSHNYEIHWGEAINLIIGMRLKEALENEDNGFFVSAVLTKLFGYGNDEWGRG